jgi:hypothetical protein
MQFRESANLLDAVKQFMTHFEKYKHITAIAELINRVDNIRSFLTRKIRAMFVELSQVSLKTDLSSLLSQLIHPLDTSIKIRILTQLLM